MRRILRPLATAGLLALIGLATAALAEDTPEGRELYALCMQCHGAAGQGNQAVGAPPIAGMAEWYVKKQLYKFKDGIRGAHPADHEGLRMRPMVRFLKNDAWIDTVAAYVATLEPGQVEPTLMGGDAARGADLYAPCSACHGAAGQGVEATKGAPLAGLSDWYLYRSLEKFKAGIRGSNPADVEGALMRGMVSVLADDQAMKDVIAHIMTFQ